MRWPSTLRHLPSRLFESAVLALEVAIGLGLVSGTTVALVLGKFLLAGILVLLLLGIVLRFTRRRVRERGDRTTRHADA